MAAKRWIRKTPLLRAMQALNKQALRVLKFFGNEDVKRVYPTSGPRTGILPDRQSETSKNART